MHRIIKQSIAVLLILALSLACTLTMYAEDDDGSELIPVRAFFEEAGASVEWNNEDRIVSITLGEDVFLLLVDLNIGIRNGTVIAFQHDIVISQGRTYISAADLQSLLTEDYLGGAIGVATVAAGQFMDMFSIPGITVAIVDAEEGFTWTGGFGFADVDGGVPIDEYTLFGLASISKTFTATAVMQLIEAGIIELDEPIVTYLPDFSVPTDPTEEGDYRNITVRMLLAHASGIWPDIMTSGSSTTGKPNPDFLNNYLEIMSDFPMMAQEASAFTYANNGFTLLGILVAEMMGYDDYFNGYASYMRENVFDPLGMDLTTFILEDRNMPHLAQSYADATTLEEVIYFNALPAGGIYSNAHDMSIFMHTLLNEGAYDGEESRILASESVTQMFELQDTLVTSKVSIINPALGILHSKGLDGFSYVGHGGNVIHYHSSMIFDLESGLGVFVSVNSITGIEVVEALSVLILQTAIREKTGTINMPESDSTVVPVELTAEELEEFEGVYFFVGSDSLANLTVGENALIIENLTGSPEPVSLMPLSDGSFLYPETGVRFWFEEIDDEMVLTLGEFKSVFAGMRIDQDAIVEIPEDLYRWLGTYHPVMDEEWHVSIIGSAEFLIDENDIAYVLLHPLHNATSISLLVEIDDGEYLGINFIEDGDDLVMDLSGVRMVKD